MATTIAGPATNSVHTLDFVRVTENAALAASRRTGRGGIEVDIAVLAIAERAGYVPHRS
ncbi:MAG: hypothetical protein ACXWNK_15980 [Vulcanimicrobiaceae bacterium]